MTTVTLQKAPQFDCAKEAASYFSLPTKGFRDVTRAVGITGDFGSFVRDLKNQGAGIFTKFASVGSGASSFLAGAEFIQNLKDVEESNAKLQKAKQLAPSAEKRDTKIAKARTDLAMAGVSTINSGSEFSIFILQTLFPAIVKALNPLALVMNVTTLITDTYAVYQGGKKAVKAKEKQHANAMNPHLVEKYEFKKNMGYMKAIKNTASVGLAVLGLLALAFAALASHKVFVLAGITFATVFLVFNVAMHFYSRQTEVESRGLIKA